MAEVYWDLEWTLQQQGFDYTYDKRLYDRLRHGNTKAIREHFYAEPGYQVKLARFLENHDEPRAASVFEIDTHKAAAVITFLSPGLRFFHQGEFEGRMKRISPHLVRAPQEPVNKDLQHFYTDLLSVIRDNIFRNGQWRLLDCKPAWDGNGSWDALIAFAWEEHGRRSIISVNYSPHSSQCYIPLPFPEFRGETVRFRDRMSAAVYDRDGNDIMSKGIYLDLPAWGYHIFEITLPEMTNVYEPSILVPKQDEVMAIRSNKSGQITK